MAAAHVTEMGDAGEVVVFQGFQHQSVIHAGVAAHGLIENFPMARVLGQILEERAAKLPDKAFLLPLFNQVRKVLPGGVGQRAFLPEGHTSQGMGVVSAEQLAHRGQGEGPVVVLC